MKKIYRSIIPVANDSVHVKINESAIEDFVKEVRKEEFDMGELKKEDKSIFNEDEFISYIFIMSSLQFCFWGNPKWTVQVNGQDYDGSTALIKILKKAHEDKTPILDPDFLADLDKQTLSVILKGYPEIPLLDERSEILRELGVVVKDRFNGSFANIIKMAEFDAIKMVNVLANYFPKSFNDCSEYNNKKVYFYKKAQIVCFYLATAFDEGLVPFCLKNIDNLTGLADYKAPQILRGLGITEYSDSLSKTIDKKVVIPKDSSEEIEIRANTIYSNFLITEKLKTIYPEITPRRVHKILWFRSQNKKDLKPYHRTVTTYY